MISCIVPVFNAYRGFSDGFCYLAQCLDSVLNNGMDRDLVDLVIVDDGSYDGTDSRIPWFRNWGGGRNTVVSLAHNRGVSHALNVGLAVARHDIVTFVGSDDLLPKGMLSAAVAHLEKTGDALVAGIPAKIDESGNIVMVEGDYATNGDEFTDKIRRGFCNNCGPVFRKQVLVDAGGYDESLTHAEDLDMYLRLSRYHTFGWVNDIFYLSRMPGARCSLSHDYATHNGLAGMVYGNYRNSI